jgi:hypothetical protein
VGQTLRKKTGGEFLLMHGSAHFNIEKQAYREKMGDEGRAAITQEGKGNTGDGEQADGHANIKDDVKGDGTDEPESKKKTESIRGSECDV